MTALCEGSHGFVSDDYLSNIAAETDLTAMELVTLGLWERAGDGYVVHDPQMLELAIEADKRVRQIHRLDDKHLKHRIDSKSRQALHRLRRFRS